MASPDAKTDLLWFLGIFALVGLVWFFTGGPKNPEAVSGPFISPPTPLGSSTIRGSESNTAPSTRTNYQSANYNNATASRLRPGEVLSSWSGQVKINTGNARYEVQANREYISLEANHNNTGTVNVSGWRLTNSKNPSLATAVVVPLATRLLVAGINHVPADPVLLAAGGRAFLTTGGIPTVAPYRIDVGFLVNKCSGYLGSLPDYRFTPSLYGNCPTPRDEVGVNNLEEACYDFIDRMSSCTTPRFESRVDGVGYLDSRENAVNNACRNYIQTHFNYNSCVGYHSVDADFYGREWHLFLQHPWQLWDDSREIISLYDNQGRLVDRVSY